MFLEPLELYVLRLHLQRSKLGQDKMMYKKFSNSLFKVSQCLTWQISALNITLTWIKIIKLSKGHIKMSLIFQQTF